MQLFDIVRDLNDKIAYNIGRGKPHKRVPYLTGTTDGYNVVINFMGEVVWESSEWTFPYGEDDDVTEEMVKNETIRIRKYITTECQKLLTQFFSIQLD